MVKINKDDDIIQKYTVEQLDMLHDICGLGEEWRKSSRRKELVRIEERELELVRRIISDIKITRDE
jgi:hypothetical protein